jgi:hypothetical protein
LGRPNEIGAAGWCGETFGAENGAEGPWIAIELVLEVVGDLLWICGGSGNPLEQPSAYSDLDLRVGADIAEPVRGSAPGRGDHDLLTSLLISERGDPGEA